MSDLANTTEFYCTVQNPRYPEVANWLIAQDIRPTQDLVRIRFRIPNDTSVYSEFIRLYVQVCPMVPPDEYAPVDTRVIRSSRPRFS